MTMQFEQAVAATMSVRTLPPCPHCGTALVAPDHSEFHGAGRIRHYWSCDECGETHETQVAVVTH